MSTTIELEPIPLSGSRLLGLTLISIAVILSISRVTDRRIELGTKKLAVELSSLETKVEASLLEEVVPQVTTQPAPEPLQAPVVTEVVETPPPVVKKPAKPIETPKPAITGSKAEWLAASNIAQSDWPTADWLIGKESGWNPCAYNPSQSDCGYTGNRACGLAQALPCSKLREGAGCKMTDAVCQLNWANAYVNSRYNGWAGAKAHSEVKGWY